jgi:hypothetical protein
MDTRRIDLTNIGLMLISCALAFVIPFELFLFSYAVLGPLHYLTEITWLKKRDCFTNGKKDYIYLTVLCVILTIIVLVSTYKNMPLVHDLDAFGCSIFGDQNFHNFANSTIFLAFFSSLAFVIFKDWVYKFVFLLVALVISLMIQNTPPFLIFFGILLPTIIHVFVFTGLFIIQGAIKKRSATGIASAVVFILCAAVFFIWKPVFNFYSITEYARKAIFMDGKGMINLNAALINMFDMGKATMETLFQSTVGLSIARFIAFAYTYHYLNWFSKTEVIKWHKVPLKWLLAVIALWIFSVALYLYDYKTGLMALYFLSLLHVFYEFPLNYRSIIGISEEVASLAGFRKAAVVKNPAPAAKSRKK